MPSLWMLFASFAVFSGNIRLARGDIRNRLVAAGTPQAFMAVVAEAEAA